MPKRRLNPLAFPAETNGRFTILFTSAIILTWLIGYIFLTILAEMLGFGSPLVEALEPMAAVIADVAESEVYFQDLPSAELAAYYQNLRAPLIHAWLTALPWVAAPVIMVLLLLGIAWFIYRTHPYRIHYRYRYELLPPDRSPLHGLEQAVKELAAQASIIPAPDILVHKLAKQEHPDGQAFGVGPRYQIRLKAQLLFQQRRPQFKALILHEFGHIVNNDIWRTYFAAALWATFSVMLLGMAAVIVLIVLVGSPPGGLVTLSPWGLLGRVVLTVLIAMAIWRSLLQIREYYADWRAATWGQEDDLRRWLAAETVQSKSWWQQTKALPKSGWRQIITFHPSVKERGEVLADPVKLFRINRQLPFFTGFLLAIAMIGLPVMVGWVFMPIFGLVEIALTTWAAVLFRSPAPANMILFMLVNFAFKILPLLLLGFAVLGFIGYLLTTTLGVQVQRETIADMARRVVHLRSYGRLALSALWLTVGVQIGLLLTPVGYAVPTTWQTLAFTIGWLIAFFTLTWLWLAYLRALTQIILGSHVGQTDPRRGKALITFLSSISLAILYPLAFLLILLAWIGDRAAILPFAAGPDLSSGQFMAINVFILASVAVVYFLGAGLSLIILYGVLGLESAKSCPTCGEQISHKIVLGQTCSYCEQPLSLWIYLDET